MTRSRLIRVSCGSCSRELFVLQSAGDLGCGHGVHPCARRAGAGWGPAVAAEPRGAEELARLHTGSAFLIAYSLIWDDWRKHNRKKAATSSRAAGKGVADQYRQNDQNAAAHSSPSTSSPARRPQRSATTGAPERRARRRPGTPQAPRQPSGGSPGSAAGIRYRPSLVSLAIVACSICSGTVGCRGEHGLTVRGTCAQPGGTARRGCCSGFSCASLHAGARRRRHRNGVRIARLCRDQAFRGGLPCSV